MVLSNVSLGLFFLEFCPKVCFYFGLLEKSYALVAEEASSHLYKFANGFN